MIMYTILPSIVCLDLVPSCSMSSVISSPTSLDWKHLEYVLLSVYNACRSFMIKRLILCYIFQCPSLILHQWAESLIDSLRTCIYSLLPDHTLSYTVDKTLPGVITDVGNTFMNVVSTLVVILVATPGFILVLVPIAFYYFKQQRVYVKTSREVKRLDSITKSPVYILFMANNNKGMHSFRRLLMVFIQFGMFYFIASFHHD